MRIAVIGGTGAAGRAVVVEAARRGHEVRGVGRHAPEDPVPGTEFALADASTGDGLDDALRGVDAVVDCANIVTTSGRKATDFFVSVTRNLMAAGTAAGVNRHVVPSIVGIDDVPLPYYRAKLAHERAAREGGVPVTVVRATQFHDFPRQVLAMTAKGPVALVPRVPMQPVSTADVAAVLVDAAEQGDRPGAPDLLQVGGPERRDLVDLARRTLRAQHRRVAVLPLPVPGRIGRARRHETDADPAAAAPIPRMREDGAPWPPPASPGTSASARCSAGSTTTRCATWWRRASRWARASAAPPAEWTSTGCRSSSSSSR